MSLKYTKEHEWIKLEGNVAVIGITEHAAEALGTLVYVELPAVGKTYNKGDAFAVVESSKSASDVYIPLSGEVVEINEALTSAPELVNNATYTDGWIAKVKVSNASELDGAMDEAAYTKYLADNA